MGGALDPVDREIVAAPLCWDMLEISSRISNKESLS